MAHTRNTDPYRVMSADPARREAHPSHSQWLHNRGECDLDEGPASGRCRYWVSPAYRSRYRYTNGPTKQDRHQAYWAPTRRAVRDQLRRAIFEHDFDDDFDDSYISTMNHRHHMAGGGYWD